MNSKILGLVALSAGMLVGPALAFFPRGAPHAAAPAQRPAYHPPAAHIAPAYHPPAARAGHIPAYRAPISLSFARPNIHIANRPSVRSSTIVNRPTRPVAPPRATYRPGAGTVARPAVRPDRIVRPERPGAGRVIDRTRIGGDRTRVGGNRITNINRGGRFASVDRGARFMTQMNRFNRPWWRHDGGWYHGGWANWPYYPAFWSGLAGGYWLSPWAVGSTFAYDNPYYAAPEDVIPELNYSDPIPVATDTEVANSDEDTVTAAMNHFAQARALFKQGRYADATAEADAAIQLLPSDRTIHEFRALTLFARGIYDQAAAGVYAVLAEGPGWDWSTMIGLYDNAATYTAQLRALEAFVADRPRDGAARFLLAYHYLVMDDRQAALSQLTVVAKLRPDDKLTAQLIQALTTQSDATLAAPPAPGQ